MRLILIAQQQRAQGKPGAQARPQPRMQKEKHTSKSPQVRLKHPAFPARLVLTVSFALFLVIGLFVTIIPGKRKLAPRT
jgi:hypothetical protein